ncbi:IS481 family transposase [Microbacterium trichothecenolyticum]|uniref:Transposase InsO family protein n=1 Tax=Microbacterium trichothecenolyticum TaxID=69370 RepID=A0ABU0TSS9_MICTR|nr:IS481 family transposase [Microbacterium trichothecenolyticum]MDQ1122720.1 transposase InsO family protein [Microbacterium trichothecenolyticum]
MSHANAVLAPAGRLRLARLIVDEGWPLRRAAERFGVGVTTAARWACRYREAGAAGMADRCSRPRVNPNRTRARVERRVVSLRVSRRWGPARIAAQLRLNRSTVQAILRRYGCPPLRWTDPGTGVRIKTSRAATNRYEAATPGDLVHMDVKKLGRIPDGGGHRIHGPAQGKRNRAGKGHGYAFIHSVVDDHTRMAYSEILSDERKDTVTAFWTRAHAWFQGAGIEVKAVMTDNGNGYRSHLFRDALGPIRHIRTRPYRPQTNGKVERLNRTLLQEWAYARAYRSETERTAAFAPWLHHYNHHRTHTAINGTPASRVPNLPSHNT